MTIRTKVLENALFLPALEFTYDGQGDCKDERKSKRGFPIDDAMTVRNKAVQIADNCTDDEDEHEIDDEATQDIREIHDTSSFQIAE